MAYVDDAGGAQTHDFALRGQFIAQRGWCPDLTALPPPPPPPGPPPNPPPPPLDAAAAAASAAAGGDGGGDGDGDGGDGDGDGDGGDIGDSWYSLRSVGITNASASVSLDFFCTTSHQAGPWAIAVIADDIQGPINLPHELTAGGGGGGGGADCRNGFVGPAGVPIYMSPSAMGARPQCNPGGGSNELKRNRPTYQLRVIHRAFEEGLLAAREVRPGCISYGQMRRFTVAASGEAAANLYVELSSKVSRLLIAEATPPTLEEHTVSSVDDVALAAADSSSALPPPNGTQMQTSASASPCDPTAVRTWHVAVYLADEAEALAQGLRQSSFDLSSTLSTARRLSPDVIEPRALGGTGSTCCGQMT